MKKEKIGFLDKGKGTIIENCEFYGYDIGIKSEGEKLKSKENKIFTYNYNKMDKQTKWLKFVGPEQEIGVSGIQTKSGKHPEKDEKLIVKKGESFLVTNKVANDLFSSYRGRFIEDFSINNIGNKQEKNWQNSYIKYIFVSIIVLFIGGFITYGFTNYQESKKTRNEFILNYQELTQVLIPYLQIYFCTKIELKDDISRQEFINKDNKLNDILLKLKNNFKEIDNNVEVSNFPNLLDEQIISVKAFECKDFINKKNNLDLIYNKIID